VKFTKTSYSGTKEILKFPDHYVAVPVTVSDVGIAVNADGKKIVPKGTIVGGANASVLADDTQEVTEKNTQAVASSLTIDCVNANADILVTAKEAGAAGDSIKVELRDPGAANQTLAVSIEGDTIVVSLATDGAGAITSTAQNVIDAINAHLIAKDLVVAAVPGGQDGTGVVEAKAAANLANGNDGTAKDAEGVLLNDVDVTYGSASGAMVVQGYIATDKLPAAPAADAVKALKQIQFIK